MSEWAPHVRAQLARLQLDGSRELAIVEELSQHLDERFEALRREGHDEARARALAVEELLEPDSLAAQMTPLRQAARTPPPVLGGPQTSRLGDLWQDLRYGWRMLRKNPLIAATAILTIALGIGANSAIFALVDATLLRPLPFPDPAQIVMVWERTPTTSRGLASPLNMLDWARRGGSFAAIGGFAPNVGGMVMGNAEGLADTVSRQWVTADIFTALGVQPLAGRVFLPSDDVQRRNVVVLGEDFWRERFRGDRQVVGREVRLDGELYTVVGVVPRAAQVIGRSDLWALIPIQGAPPRARGSH
jgi:putative ABC transport system permease protein